MRRASFVIDNAQMAPVQPEQSTTGTQETTELAEHEADRARLRRHLAARIRSGGGIERAEVLAVSRRWDH